MASRSVRSAFTLIELLVVVAILALLVAILLPSLRGARLQAQRVYCASNLHQQSLALSMYISDQKDRLPYVECPLWSKYSTTGQWDWNADPTALTPTGEKLWPFSYQNVMLRYLLDRKADLCPSAKLGYPKAAFQQTYRVSAANNKDGKPRLVTELLGSATSANYNYSLKYLNGRRYEMKFVDASTFPFRLVKGVGPFYLMRDFVDQEKPPGDGPLIWKPPHPKGPDRLRRGGFNQLFLDMHVELVYLDRTGIDFSYP